MAARAIVAGNRPRPLGAPIRRANSSGSRILRFTLKEHAAKKLDQDILSSMRSLGQSPTKVVAGGESSALTMVPERHRMARS